MRRLLAALALALAVLVGYAAPTGAINWVKQNRMVQLTAAVPTGMQSRPVVQEPIGIFINAGYLPANTSTAPATPATPTVNGCNWSCPTHVDAWEDRDTTKIDLATGWRIGNTSQDACIVSIFNDGVATHGMRAQVYKISTGTVIWDSGHLTLEPNEQAVFNTHMSPEPFSAHIAVKGWNDVGDITYDDYWIDVPDDTNTIHTFGYWDPACT